MKKVPGVVDPGVSREKTNPEYAINVNREKAASLGLSVYDVAMATRGYLYGNAVTKYREGGDEYDIYVRLRPEDRRGLEDVKSAFVTTRTGQNVALGNLADLELKSGPQMIQRKNQQRMVIVNSDFFGRSLGDVVDDVKKILNKTAFPPGVTYKVTGSAEQMQESFQSLFVALLLGICLIYLVMVAQFESFFEPFVVMFAIPFGLIGVIWALFLTGKPFGVMPFIGLIMVTGVAVKTSIVLVDYINILRARGLEIKEAIQQAGKTRLRPILMTSITTLLGLMPIVLGRGEGSAFWKTMAIGVVGGILVSGAITLFFVPALYYVLENRLRQARRRS
jgi:multidrug efflux pump subunit AcrB